MKKIILTVMSLAVAIATMWGQEQTAAPGIVAGCEDHFYSIPDDYFSAKMYDTYIITYNIVTFENNDEDEVTIYYRLDNDSDWNEYNSESLISGSQYQGTVEAYAVAEGKLPSEKVSTELFLYDIYLYSTCVVDGIHYYFEDFYLYDAHHMGGNPSFLASVCSRTESQLYSPPYAGYIVIPSEIEIRGETYAVTGIRNASFASTFNQSCDITGVELPSTILEVNPSTFAGCTRLTSMVIHAVEPPYSGSLFESEYDDENYGYYNYIEFDGNQLYDQVMLFVPQEGLEAYKAHEEWGRFTHIVPFIGAGPGDLNGDDTFDVDDVIVLIQMLLDGGTLPAYADLNGDGVSDIDDVILLISRLLNGN